MTEVRKATPEMFDDVYRLLVGFQNHRMSKDDWKRMLFQYPWPAEDEQRGYVLLDRGEAVGFIGTIFSTRVVKGQEERFCNLSCWIVRESHRAKSLALLAPIVGMKSHTLVNLTPSKVTHQIFTRCGYHLLEDRLLMFPPLSSRRDLSGFLRASITTDPAEVRAELRGEELRWFDDHRSSIATHVLVRRGERAAWAVATPMRMKRIRFALIHHIGDPELFWECLPLVKWGFFRALGAPALAIDSRFAQGHRVPLCVSWQLPYSRLYRPARSDIGPAGVDGLYTEFMGLRL